MFNLFLRMFNPNEKKRDWDCCLSQEKQYKLRKKYFLNLLGSIYNHLYRYTRNKEWSKNTLDKNMHQSKPFLKKKHASIPNIYIKFEFKLKFVFIHQIMWGLVNSGDVLVKSCQLFLSIFFSFLWVNTL